MAALLSNARRYSAGGVAVGASRRVLLRHARPAGHGLWLGRSRLRGGARFIYALRHNKVSAVGVAGAAALSHSGRSVGKSVRLGLR